MRSFTTVAKRVLSPKASFSRLFSTAGTNRLWKLFEKVKNNPAMTEEMVRAELRKLPRERLNMPASIRSNGAEINASRWVTQVDDEQQLKEIIQTAQQDKQTIRVIGSGHSAPPVTSPDLNANLLELTGNFKKVEFLEEGTDAQGKYALVRVGAGCNLGVDPSNPQSTLENSFVYQVDQAGYAASSLGGITHQTLAGFMQTGSSGGSLKHSFMDDVETIEFVNGTGNTMSAQKGSDLFNAFGVSLGLMGVTTRVTMKLRPSYFVEGTEEGLVYEDSVLAKNGSQYLIEQKLAEMEYFRANWFPLEGVNRVSQWIGKRATTVKPIDPYESALSNCFTQLASTSTLQLIDIARTNGTLDFSLWFFRLILKEFAPIEVQSTFFDKWYKTLSSDDFAPVDTNLRTQFTEFWVPLEQTTRVMDILHKLYEDPKIALGNYAVEIYGAKRSPLWLSPSYNNNALRIDPYWWAHNSGNPAEFYANFWSRLLEVPGVRMHWGKYMPNNGQIYGQVKFDLNFLKSRYPKLDDWLRLREQMDPNQVFLTNHWRKCFEIEPNELRFRPRFA